MPTPFALDHLQLAIDLAADYNHELCVHCLTLPGTALATATAPPRECGDLSPEAAAGVELLLAETSTGRELVGQAVLSELEAVTRLVMTARVVSLFLPPVMALPPRHGLPDDCVCAWSSRVVGAASDVQQHLDEHDAGDWVDPNAVAGAVADLHDIAQAMWLWLEDEAHRPGCPHRSPRTNAPREPDRSDPWFPADGTS